MKIETIFGQILKQFREKRNISQEELAFNAGLDRTYISLLERGKRNPSIKTLFALSKVLNIKPSELIRIVELEFEEQNHKETN